MRCRIIRCCRLQCISFRKGAHTYRCTMCFSVVSEFSARCGYSDLSCIFCYGQSSDCCTDCVIAFCCRFIPGNAVGVFAASYLCLASGCCKRCGLFLNESNDASCCCQRIAVVYLACVRCRYRQCCRVDFNASIHISDVQLGGYIDSLRIFDYQGIAVGCHGSFCHMRCLIIGYCRLQCISFRKGAYTYRCTVCLSVIGEGSACCRYHDLVSVFGYG